MLSIAGTSDNGASPWSMRHALNKNSR